MSLDPKILSGVLHSDTHVRLQAGEQLLEYLRNEDNDLEEFEELEGLISGLANWMSSSNFKVRLLFHMTMWFVVCPFFLQSWLLLSSFQLFPLYIYIV